MKNIIKNVKLNYSFSSYNRTFPIDFTTASVSDDFVLSHAYFYLPFE